MAGVFDPSSPHDYYSDALDDCTDNDRESSEDGENEIDDSENHDDAIIEPESSQDLCYVILCEEEIIQRQEDAISALSSVLCLSRGDAGILLGHFGWNVTGVEEQWFANEEEVRRSAGLWDKAYSVINPNSYAVSVLTCKICFEEAPSEDFVSVACGHLFCKQCWSMYLCVSIDDGAGCLTVRCPEPRCGFVVDHETVEMLVSDEYAHKYRKFMLRSYVEMNKKIKWCPGPGCDYAVEFDGPGEEGFDVLCDCSYGFCWKCLEDSHRPVDCETVAKWILKNGSEAENTNWILANSKPCPKCKYPIEKNNGCMHMTCRPPCRYNFCWLCLGDWNKHGEKTGGYYTCNIYEQARNEGEHSREEEMREKARSMLDKYTHYYERWSLNGSSREKARRELRRMEFVQLQKLYQIYNSKQQLHVITDAFSQIVECRRVLKWSYAYGYYLNEEEVAKKNLFEHLQGQAESSLERLHYHAEMLNPFFDVQTQASEEDFQFILTGLKNLTTVTKNYFQNLVIALENDLADVESPAATINATNLIACIEEGSSEEDFDPQPH